MKFRFKIFTVIIWQPTLPEEPARTEISGDTILTYVPGEFFPDEWFFRADFDHESPKNPARGRQGKTGREIWQVEESNDSSVVADVGAPALGERRKSDSIFVQSQPLGEYADLNDHMTVGSYADLETAKRNEEGEPRNISKFLRENPEIRTLLVNIDDHAYFHDLHPSDLEAFGALKVEIHFVRRTRVIADDGCTEQ
ncbi:MAG: hypothetical protein QM681_04995 [Novosphingobium sp.]